MRGDAEGRGAEDMEIERLRLADNARRSAYDGPGVTRRTRDKLSVRAMDDAIREAQLGAALGDRSASDWLNSQDSQRGPEYYEMVRRLEADRNRVDPAEKSTKRAFKAGGLLKKPTRSNAAKLPVKKGKPMPAFKKGGTVKKAKGGMIGRGCK